LQALKLEQYAQAEQLRLLLEDAIRKVRGCIAADKSLIERMNTLRAEQPDNVRFNLWGERIRMAQEHIGALQGEIDEYTAKLAAL
jgi:hypothetical protein